MSSEVDELSAALAEAREELDYRDVQLADAAGVGRRLIRERDAATARAERAETERDELRASREAVSRDGQTAWQLYRSEQADHNALKAAAEKLTGLLLDIGGIVSPTGEWPPEALGQLLEAVRQLDAHAARAEVALQRVRALHKREFFGGVWACLACSPGMPPQILIEWPCPTIAALDSTDPPLDAQRPEERSDDPPGMWERADFTGGETDVQPEPAPAPVVFLLWSGKWQSWWRPNAAGYTTDQTRAGRYSETDALRHVRESAMCGNLADVTSMVAAPDNWQRTP